MRRPAELSTARGLSAGRLSATRLPARAGLSAARLSDTGITTAELPAALPRPVGVRWSAGIRRPRLSPATAAFVRRRARVPAATAVVRSAGIPRWIRRWLRAVAARNQSDGDLVAGGLTGRVSLLDKRTHRHRARFRRAESDQTER